MILLAGLTACGQKNAMDPVGSDAVAGNEVSAGEETLSEEAPEIIEIPFDMADMMDQVAASEVELSYTEYLPDEGFANAELYGIEDGKAYVFLNCQKFVVFKDKAYAMSGSAGEAILHYTETEDGAKLDEVEWSADGSDHDQWILENFPEDILAQWEVYDAYDENGFLKLGTKMLYKAEEALGVEVERENLLEIDPESGKYQIIKTSESGSTEDDTYEFTSEVIEEGTLD